MKRFKQVPILVVTFWMLPMLLALFVPDFCYARIKWRSIGTDTGSEGDVRCIAIDPSNSNIMYAGTDGGGVLKSNIEESVDFDGDLKTDIAIYRNGIWAIAPSLGAAVYLVGWGAPGDVPITYNRASY